MADMNLISQIPAAELTGYAREALADLEQNQASLGEYFPARETNDIVFSWNTGGGGLAKTASWRAYDAEADYGSREGFSRKTAELPPMSRKLLLGEYERLRLLNNTDAAIDAVYDDVDTLLKSVSSRLAVARGEALVNGTLDIVGNGLVGLQMNFGRAAGHSVTSSVDWSTVATADPLADLQSAIATYTATNGFGPGGILTSSLVVGEMLQNDNLRSLVFAGSGSPTRLSRAQLDALLSDFAIPPITVNDAQVSVDGVTTRVLAQDTVVLTPPSAGDAGATVWGTTLEAQENLGLVGSEAPGVVAFLERTDRTPIQYHTSVAARSVPVLANPDLTFVIDTTGP